MGLMYYTDEYLFGKDFPENNRQEMKRVHLEENHIRLKNVKRWSGLKKSHVCDGDRSFSDFGGEKEWSSIKLIST